MPFRVRIALGLLVLGSLGLVAWPTVSRREPVYHRKPLGYWINLWGDVYAPWNADFPDYDRKPMGWLPEVDSHAIPFLVDALARQDGWLERAYLRKWLGFPPWLRARVPRPIVARLVRVNAAYALGEMGAAARPALPALMRSLSRELPRGERAAVLVALGKIGKQDLAVRAVLAEALSDPQAGVRSGAADAPGVSPASKAEVTDSYGLTLRSAANAYLAMPQTDRGPFPPLLSQTGVFKSTRDLTPADSLVPYDINVPFYSDGAAKSRWLSVPNEPSVPSKIQFSAKGDWGFPNGTVFVKHFELITDETRPITKHRLETRILVRDASGGVYGVTYKWRPDNTDAELLTSNLTETFQIRTATGVRTQTWYYPSRQDCRTCHTPTAGGVLGLKTRQLNRDFKFPSGIEDNELRAWNHVGLFEPALKEEDIASYDKLARADDSTRSLEERARSYLDVNCAYCHRPGGTVAYFDARYDTPLPRQGLINGPALIDEGLDRARVISPNDVWRSVALVRISSLEGLKMPPLAHETLDEQGTALLRAWIQSLPGPKVLSPPTFSAKGGPQEKPLELRLTHPEPRATIHYTLDGSAPAVADPVYDGPIRLTESTTVRARAFKAGFNKSITVQETFVFPRKP
jgi:uncharacterized repeat protein (TIGR03806 family)